MHFPLVLVGFPSHQSHRQILPFYLRCQLLHFPESLPSSCPSSVTQNLLRLSPPLQTISYQSSVLECQNSFQLKKKNIYGSSHKLARCSLTVFLQQAAVGRLGHSGTLLVLHVHQCLMSRCSSSLWRLHGHFHTTRGHQMYAEGKAKLLFGISTQGSLKLPTLKFSNRPCIQCKP